MSKLRAAIDTVNNAAGRQLVVLAECTVCGCAFAASVNAVNHHGRTRTCPRAECKRQTARVRKQLFRKIRAESVNGA
jgi:hypothetical protein